MNTFFDYFLGVFFAVVIVLLTGIITSAGVVYLINHDWALGITLSTTGGIMAYGLVSSWKELLLFWR